MLNITGRKKMEERLKQNLEELERANRQIIEQQKTVIEEERLKVLLQMAGATAHEMNQPLMALLGYIELMSIHKNNKEKMDQYITKVENAGRRLADIVKKIQMIRHDEVKSYPGDSTILNLDQPINILSIEDNDHDYSRIQTILIQIGNIDIFRARDIDEVFRIISDHQLDIIFLDHFLPSCTGLDLLHQMKDKGIETPVVFITGSGDETVASKAIQAGAYEYIPKTSVSIKSISRVIYSTMEKYRLKNEVKQAMAKMAKMSTKDALTGLYNRRYFMEICDRETSGVQRYKSSLVLCLMDLDHFKNINDTYGHQCGDEVLKIFSELVLESIRKSDIACRYGGEEFAVLFPHTAIKDALSMCERFRKTIENHPIPYNEATVNVTVSMGLSPFYPDTDSFSSVIHKADKALNRAKKEGHNRIVAM